MRIIGNGVFVIEVSVNVSAIHFLKLVLQLYWNFLLQSCYGKLLLLKR